MHGHANAIGNVAFLKEQYIANRSMGENSMAPSLS